MKIIKTFKALSKSYVFFKVNDEFYLTYGKASHFCDLLKPKGESLIFEGFSLFWFFKDLFFPKDYQKEFGFKKGWRGFYTRINYPSFVNKKLMPTFIVLQK